MSLRKIERRRAPTDRWFRTTAKLNSLLRAMSHYDDEAFESTSKRINDLINDTTVPVWVRMEKYKAMETKAHPGRGDLGACHPDRHVRTRRDQDVRVSP